MTVEPLGIDHVIFAVADLDAGVAFYERCGVRPRWRSDEKGIAIFAIRSEEPGLLLRRSTSKTDAGRLRIEVRDAFDAAEALEADGAQTIRIETATGIPCEVSDPSDNVIGFADYRRRPNFALERV